LSVPCLPLNTQGEGVSTPGIQDRSIRVAGKEVEDVSCPEGALSSPFRA